MTPTQTDVIGKLKTEILAQDSYGHETEYEFKKFHVMEFPGERWCVLHTVVGHVGDENTLAAMLYRKERVLWIGARGRVIWLNEHDPKHAPALTLETALKEPYRTGGRSRPAQNHGHA